MYRDRRGPRLQKGIFCWKVTYNFEAKPGQGTNAWAAVLLDAGYQVLDANGNPQTAVDQAFGRSFTSPILLNGSGKALGPGGSPVFLTFYLYLNSQFSLLNLP